MLREGVYYSFRLEGQWSPYIGSGRKFPRRNPGVFKIQVQRRMAEGESLGPDDPIEQFLSLLVRDRDGDQGRLGKSRSPPGDGLASVGRQWPT